MAILRTLYLRRPTETVTAAAGLEWPRRGWARAAGRLEVLHQGRAGSPGGPGEEASLPASGRLCAEAGYLPCTWVIPSQPQEPGGPGALPRWVSTSCWNPHELAKGPPAFCLEGRRPKSRCSRLPLLRPQGESPSHLPSSRASSAASLCLLREALPPPLICPR